MNRREIAKELIRRGEKELAKELLKASMEQTESLGITKDKNTEKEKLSGLKKLLNVPGEDENLDDWSFNFLAKNYPDEIKKEILKIPDKDKNSLFKVFIEELDLKSDVLSFIPSPGDRPQHIPLSFRSVWDKVAFNVVDKDERLRNHLFNVLKDEIAHVLAKKKS